MWDVNLKEKTKNEQYRAAIQAYAGVPWHLVDKTNFNGAFLITALHKQHGELFPYLIAEVVTEGERTEHKDENFSVQ